MPLLQMSYYLIQCSLDGSPMLRSGGNSCVTYQMMQYLKSLLVYPVLSQLQQSYFRGLSLGSRTSLRGSFDSSYSLITSSSILSITLSLSPSTHFTLNHATMPSYSQRQLRGILILPVFLVRLKRNLKWLNYFLMSFTTFSFRILRPFLASWKVIMGILIRISSCQRVISYLLYDLREKVLYCFDESYQRRVGIRLLHLFWKFIMLVLQSRTICLNIQGEVQGIFSVPIFFILDLWVYIMWLRSFQVLSFQFRLYGKFLPYSLTNFYTY